MITVSFHTPASVEDGDLKFAVIAAKYEGYWLFCRHRQRHTWEIPGGHCESGETVWDTARRELREETGASAAELQPLTVYAVTSDGVTTYGMLFLAEIRQLEPLSAEVEIGEIRQFDALPEALTYPAIQPHLFAYARDRQITKATVEDVPAVAKLAGKLWGSHREQELAAEFSELLRSEETAVFLRGDAAAPLGFAQCGLRRDYVEGTSSSPVGYLEGIYVEEEYRGQGHAKALLERCQAWAKEKGCREFASDCQLENETSLGFHLKLGFTEANRIICFTKKL